MHELGTVLPGSIESSIEINAVTNVFRDRYVAWPVCAQPVSTNAVRRSRLARAIRARAGPAS
jgi:hypothetical protein